VKSAAAFEATKYTRQPESIEVACFVAIRSRPKVEVSTAMRP